MTSMKVTSLVKPALLLICAIAFTLSAFNSTTAKSRSNTFSKRVTKSEGRATAVNGRDAKRTLLRIIKREVKANPKLAESLSPACNCAVACQDFDASGSCFKNCVTSWGINYGSLTTCGAVCAVAATGNPVAIGICAACVGTSEWIIAGCVMRCAWGGTTNYLEIMSIREPRTRHTRRVYQAKLSLKRIPAGS